MPTAALHSHYWAADTAAAPPVVSANGGYVAWQTTVIIGSGFGVTQVVWDWLTTKTSTAWGAVRVRDPHP